VKLTSCLSDMGTNGMRKNLVSDLKVISFHQLVHMIRMIDF